MKNIPAAMTAHLSEEVTTLTQCWRIVREDGVVLGFTAHDRDLDYQGITYKATTGFNRTAISQDDTMSVANVDVEGIIDHEDIKDEDLRNGLFDRAQVFVFMINWKNPDATGDVKLRRGWFGEVSMDQKGKFTTEIRGMAQALSHNFIQSFTPECRTDFCSTKCKLVASDYTRPGVVLSSDSRLQFTAAHLEAVTTIATSVGAHKQWRILIESGLNFDFGGFAEIQFWDQQGNMITGGSATASSYSSGYKPSKARDGDRDTMWITEPTDLDPEHPTTVVGNWWDISFSTPVDIKEFTMSATDDYTLCPTTFQILYSDDNLDHDNVNKSWHFAKTCSFEWSESYQSAMWAFGSATPDPINFPNSPTAVPPPFTGASTYVGGLVSFKSGFNAGRSMEIIAVDGDTITLFDGMYFPIVAGDTFTIMQGCDKSFDACKVYKNVINFRGEPHVPGQDEYLSYPDATS